jgi:GNAT superfamily N-acetyltransferase
VTVADLPVVLRQRESLFREMDDVPPDLVRRYLPRFRRWFRRELASGRLWGYLALSDSDVPVGGALLWLQPRLPSPRFEHSVGPYVFSVYTEPSYRGRGIATRLVSALVASAAARGYRRVELHATEMGLHVYKRLGFQPTTQMRVTLDPPRPRRRPSRPAPRTSGR